MCLKGPQRNERMELPSARTLLSLQLYQCAHYIVFCPCAPGKPRNTPAREGGSKGGFAATPEEILAFSHQTVCLIWPNSEFSKRGKGVFRFLPNQDAAHFYPHQKTSQTPRGLEGERAPPFRLFLYRILRLGSAPCMKQGRKRERKGSLEGQPLSCDVILLLFILYLMFIFHLILTVQNSKTIQTRLSFHLLMGRPPTHSKTKRNYL